MPPATEAERVVWPAAFGTRFMVTVDVEEEFDWYGPLDVGHRATTAMAAFPAAHRWFQAQGTALTCYVDHPIARDARAVAMLGEMLADGRSEIGTQLHPWVNPPFVAARPGDSYAGNLPPAVEAAKIDVLTDAIAAAFGTRPRAYRAGRYGIGPRTLALLSARGYRADSSVRAHYDYSADGGPDFGGCDSGAFRRDGILALPLTTLHIGRLARFGPWLDRIGGAVPHGRGILARGGLSSRIAMTPEDMPVDAVLDAIDRATDRGVRLITLSFHSPSLVPGHTPYVRDAADLARFWAWWNAVFDRMAARGITSASMAECLTAAGA
jgi:peptidoglycan/xylan/chitin deacetylase (PgdA/CDA1 family)